MSERVSFSITGLVKTDGPDLYVGGQDLVSIVRAVFPEHITSDGVSRGRLRISIEMAEETP